MASDQSLTAAEVRTTPAFAAGERHPLFAVTMRRGTGMTGFAYAPSHDGKRFLIVTGVAEVSSDPITVVLHWKADRKSR